MEKPLFYVETEKCTLCFACIRNCPVKAIDVKDLTEWADISTDRCIGCGICYHICPVNAIQFRQTIDEVTSILSANTDVIAICDPSISSEFTDISDYKKFVSMLRMLGFSKVHEAAFAVDIVALQYKKLFSDFKGKYYLTANCPSVVELVEKYHPDLIDNLSPIPSPMIVATAIMRKIYGETAKVVYIGPCIANKNELLKYTGTLRPDAALTFIELRQLFDARQITDGKVEYSDFDSPIGEKGALYPISEGILESCSPDKSLLTRPIQTVESSLDVKEAIKTFEENIEMLHKHLNLFMCQGCMMGPGCATLNNKHTRSAYTIDYAKKRISSLNYTKWEAEVEKYSTIEAVAIYKANDQRRKLPGKKQIAEILTLLGDNNNNLEHGCGACGFKNCAELAVGIAQGNGHPDMCLRRSINSQKALSRFMKQNDERIRLLKIEIEQYKGNLEKKEQLFINASNALTSIINKVSAGIVLYDNHLKIVETNSKFIDILGEEAELINEVIPGLKGADLKTLIPTSVNSMFEFALQSNESIVDKDIAIGEQKFILNVFTIETEKMAGAIIRNFHAPDVLYDEFEKRINEVIDENLRMVQQIGFLLGEGASETERMLNSVIESFKKEQK
jgi:iron only hydrogenase large subunit-like protein